MRFLNPYGLLLLLGVPVLIAIYLIKSRHEDRPVSSTYIWKLSERFMKKRIPLQKLRKIIAFVLQLLVIIAISLIASRPAVISGDAIDYVVIIDGSASMNTEDGTGKTRFQHAIEETEELAEEINSGHTVSVILAGDSSHYLVQKSSSLNEVKLALKNAECSFGGCDIDSAINMSKLVSERSENFKILLFTDKEYDGSNISIVNLNNNEWNVAVTDLSYKTSGKEKIFTGTLTSYNKDATLTVGLKIDGDIVDANIFECEQNTELTVSFTVSNVTSFDTAELFVETSDALKSDNSYAICNKSERTYGVLLVSSSPLYLETALNSLENCKVTVVSDLSEVELSGMDLYVFDGIYPEEYPTDGGIIVFGVDKLPDGLTAGEYISKELPLSRDKSVIEEIASSLSFSETYVSKFTQLLGNAFWEDVLFCEDYTVLATKKLDNGNRFSVVSFDIHDSNLPLKTDFVVLIKNLVENSIPALLRDTDYISGETVTFTILENVENAYVEYPDESIKTLSTASDTDSIIVDEVGIYTVVTTSEDGGEYVDFFVHIPTEESYTIAGGSISVDPSKDTGVTKEKAISELWFYIVIMILLLVLIEWWWYYREQY